MNGLSCPLPVSPSTFELLMELILNGLRFETCLIYLNDVIVYGRTFVEQLKCLEGVFVRRKSAGLMLKRSKCELFQKSIVNLGHTVSLQRLNEFVNDQCQRT